MEGLVKMRRSFWEGKKVLITGHTGFKGGWLSHWLIELGAEVIGYSLRPSTQPNLFTATHLPDQVTSYINNIINYDKLLTIMKKHKPEIIFHLAAQPLVGNSYKSPLDTYQTNVMGTVNILEAIREVDCVKVAVIVTTDKCYDNQNSEYPYKESDRLGGHDPYSSSKSCAELIVASYRCSFFYHKDSPKIATVRAGNVIGGGDWTSGRLFPDIIHSISNDRKLFIRNPFSTRPWQHVLDPLNGYITLAEKMWSNSSLEGSWNFGPDISKTFTVSEIVSMTENLWGAKLNVQYDRTSSGYESKHLSIDSNKAKKHLNWKQLISMEEAIEWSISWYKKYLNSENMKFVTQEQIKQFHALKECDE